MVGIPDAVVGIPDRVDWSGIVVGHLRRDSLVVVSERCAEPVDVAPPTNSRGP